MNKQEHDNTTDVSVTNTPETEPNSTDTRKRIRKKAIIGAAAILGACTLIFGGVTQAVLAAKTSQVENIPTTYPNSSSSKDGDDLSGYVKGNYTVKRWEGNDIVTPTSDMISMEKAAEIGAQNIWRFFGDNLDGKTIEMGYDPTSYGCWSGSVEADVDSTGVETGYHFELNEISGALYHIEQYRTFPGDRTKLLKEPDDCGKKEVVDTYKELARSTIEQHHLLSGNIASYRFSGGGSNNNDCYLTLEVTSDIGEIISLDFSCVDHALIMYYSSDYYKAKEMSDREIPYDPALSAWETANMSRLDPSLTYEVREDEKGIVYAVSVSESGEGERLRIGHTNRYVGE